MHAYSVESSDLCACEAPKQQGVGQLRLTDRTLQGRAFWERKHTTAGAGIAVTSTLAVAHSCTFMHACLREWIDGWMDVQVGGWMDAGVELHI